VQSPNDFISVPILAPSRSYRKVYIERIIMSSASSDVVSMPEAPSLDMIIFKLAVNFLLYVAFIMIFYLVVRFYLEENVVSGLDTSKYSVLPTEVQENEDMDTQLDTDIKTTAEEEENLESKDNIEDSEVNMIRRPSFSLDLNINEWGEPEGTRQEVLQQLLFCAVGLVVTFSIWGLLQERILTQPYEGQFYTYSYGLVFINRLGGLILSAAMMWFFKIPWYYSPLWEYSIPSCANMLSSWCQYEALKYVSFPTQMLAKSFKMLPTLLMGIALNNKTYESYEYFSAAIVGFGLYLFIDSTEGLDVGRNVFGDAQIVKGTWCGVVLLMLFLVFDSFNGQWQSRFFHTHKHLSPIQMMLITNAFSTVLSCITLMHDGELVASMSFIFDHTELLLHITLFCICSTIGQLFIFYTIKKFGAVFFSIIMSVRILFSTLLSCIVYGHAITELASIGIIIVFGAVAYRIQRKLDHNPIIRWIKSDVAKEIFHEWHEHLDI
jgi:adenosine 3'-phospho 5'-phosphosulfate transporter B2